MFRFIAYYTLCAAMALLATWGLWTLYRVVYAYVEYVKLLRGMQTVRVYRLPVYHYVPRQGKTS